ncbi:MAG TPA: glycosyltransferase family 4 protein, partial [Myxococcota bacterium]|nr:glycosyltransferase family 4 protein [Myxococcota bacterium]
PQVILEAMAAGVPVVSTSAGGIPGSLDHGANAVLVPCDDADALAAGVERVLDDPELAARLRSAGQRFAAEHTLELESQRLLRAWDSHFASDPRQPAPRSK